MKCDGCGAETNATHTTDTSGLMHVWCETCAAGQQLRMLPWSHANEMDRLCAQVDAIQRDSNVTLEQRRALAAEVTALRAALLEACDIASGEAARYAINARGPDTDRIAELRKLTEDA